GVIAVLLAPLRVTAGRLKVAPRICTNPDVGPGRRNRQRSNAGEDLWAPNRLPVGSDVAKSLARLQASDAWALTGDITQAGQRGGLDRVQSWLRHIAERCKTLAGPRSLLSFRYIAGPQGPALLTMVLSRRHFFLLSAAALLQPGTSGGKRDMIVRSARPLDLEMPIEGFSDYITPIDRFFVRSHVYTPRVEIGPWRLTVDGEVANALTLTMDDLRRMPSVELVSVLECAGNGRGFYEPSMPGLQWGHGAVGNGRWRGVRLADVLKRAGLKASPREVLFNGADTPLGTMPDFQRSIPIAKALHPATLLACEMNGETLPVDHGFRLRVGVPGWAGDSWVKWVTSRTVLSRGHEGFWMARAYRHP